MTQIPNDADPQSDRGLAALKIASTLLRTSHHDSITNEVASSWLASLPSTLAYFEKAASPAADWMKVSNLLLLFKEAASRMARCPQLEDSIARELNRFCNQRPLLYRTRGVWHTYDLFSAHIPTLTADLARLRGQKRTYVVDIGTREGLALCWFVEEAFASFNDVTVTSVDEGQQDSWPTLLLLDNVARLSSTVHIDVQRGNVPELLSAMPGEVASLVYVSGFVTYNRLLATIASAWPSLQPGGLMICADYRCDPDPVSEILGYNEEVKKVLHTFLETVEQQCTILRETPHLVVQRL